MVPHNPVCLLLGILQAQGQEVVEVILGAGVFEGVMPTLPEVVADLMFDSALVGVGL